MRQDDLRPIFTDAIRFWERGRIWYNAALAVVALGGIAAAFALGFGLPTIGRLLAWVFLAIPANLLYSAAYIPDLIAQISDYQSFWRKYRWLLLLFGTLLASSFTFAATFGTLAESFWD